MINSYSYNTAIGKLAIAELDDKIIAISFGEKQFFKSPYRIYASDMIKRLADEIDSYLDGRLKIFTVPINPIGTKFMLSVWHAVYNIQYGNLATYKDIARSVGNIKAVRAVGLANNKNPIPIIIPCHRVIGSDGKAVGYSAGIDIKIKLLAIEGIKLQK